MTKEERDKLIMNNTGLVYDIASRYYGLGVEKEDLVQEGFVGLLEAVERYNPDLGYRFDTYAYSWIRREILQAIYKKSKTIRIPTHIEELLRKIKKEQQEYYLMHGKRISIKELADRFGVSESRINTVLSYKDVFSYDVSVNEEEDTSLLDLIPSYDNASDIAIRNVTYSELYDIIKKTLLTDKELAVIYYLFGFADRVVTEEEVASIINTSRRNVGLLKNKAILKLRKKYSHKK